MYSPCSSIKDQWTGDGRQTIRNAQAHHENIERRPTTEKKGRMC